MQHSPVEASEIQDAPFIEHSIIGGAANNVTVAAKKVNEIARKVGKVAKER